MTRIDCAVDLTRQIVRVPREEIRASVEIRDGRVSEQVWTEAAKQSTITNDARHQHRIQCNDMDESLGANICANLCDNVRANSRVFE
jgi:hypothetical protein